MQKQRFGVRHALLEWSLLLSVFTNALHAESPAQDNMSGRTGLDRPFARLMLDGHGGVNDPRFMKDLNLDRIADQVVRSGAKVVGLPGKGINGHAWFDTRVGVKYEALGAVDFVAELVKRLHAHGIHVGAIFETLDDTRLWEQHPDWRCVDAFGKTPREKAAKRLKNGSVGPWGPGQWAEINYVCLNSPGLPAILDMARDMLKRIPLDYVWMDMPIIDPGLCYCRYCQERYRKDFGHDIPRQANWDNLEWRRHMLWRRQNLVQYTRAFVQACHEARPGVIVKVNDLPGVSVDQALEADVELHDPSQASKGDGEYNVMLKLYKSLAKPGTVPEIVLYRQGPNYELWSSTRSPSQMLDHAFNAIANGCAFMAGEFILQSGVYYNEAINRHAAVLNEVRRREPWLTAAEIVPYAAMYYSDNSRELYGRNDYLHGPAERSRYVSSPLGFGAAMNEEHVPWEMVHHRNLAERLRSGVRVLVLPNAACMDEATAEQIRIFVHNGGGLVAAYETSLYDEEGTPRKDFLLSDVLGVTRKGKNDFYQDFVRITAEHPVTRDAGGEIPVQHLGGQVLVKAADDAQVLARITTPYWKRDMLRSIDWMDPPGVDTDHPAIVVRQFGKGRVVYFAGRIDHAYYCLGMRQTKARTLLANAVRWAAGEDLLKVDAPRCVYATLFRQPAEKRILVHLVNNQPTEDTVPVHDLHVALRSAERFATARLEPDGKDLKFRHEADWIYVDVPKLEHHGIVVLTRP